METFKTLISFYGGLAFFVALALYIANYKKPIVIKGRTQQECIHNLKKYDLNKYNIIELMSRSKSGVYFCCNSKNLRT